MAEYERGLIIHRTIDQYHLIQKAEELKLLYEAFEMMRIDQGSIERRQRCGIDRGAVDCIGRDDGNDGRGAHRAQCVAHCLAAAGEG